MSAFVEPGVDVYCIHGSDIPTAAGFRWVSWGASSSGVIKAAVSPKHLQVPMTTVHMVYNTGPNSNIIPMYVAFRNMLFVSYSVQGFRL